MTPRAHPPLSPFLPSPFSESITIADYFTVKEGDKVAYRPTVQYSYHPCDDAVMSIHEVAGCNFAAPERQRLLMDEIIDGMAEWEWGLWESVGVGGWIPVMRGKGWQLYVFVFLFLA